MTAAAAAAGPAAVLPPELVAAEPPEVRGAGRGDVRLLLGGPAGVSHHRFADLPALLAPDDVLVVNTSATLPAAVPVPGTDLVLHVSSPRPDGAWLVELRQRDQVATAPYRGGEPGQELALPGGGRVRLRHRFAGGRLWEAELATGGAGEASGAGAVPAYLRAYGRPIRYGYVPREWPLASYQTVFATEPGSAEMPSAARPFTPELVVRLVTAGVVVAPITLHTGVASLEVPEPPYPEPYAVPATTARLVNQARAAGGRAVAVGTTAARALESAAGADAVVRPSAGWTELVLGPQRPVRVTDGLLTGFHEPESSHLQLLTAVAGGELVARVYQEAVAGGYRWHEFGDTNLLLSR